MNGISPHMTELSLEQKRILLKEKLRQKAHQATTSHPLSYGQQALWFLYQNAPESAAYNGAFTVRIRSQIDVPTLRRTFQTLIARHPALRTTFPTIYDKQVQTVHGYQELYFEKIDASTWSWDELTRKVSHTYKRPFDIETGPLLRVHLFTRSLEDHILLLNAHHIIGDGWSLWQLLSEWRELYLAQMAGIQAYLSPIKLSYADYIRWQTEMLASSEGAKLWRYWQKQLTGELPVLNLPTDRPRPPIQSYQGSSYAFKLTTELTLQLKELAQSEGTTLYMTLLAAFQVLLHRYTGQEDILVGSPTTGRSKPEFAKIVGYFANPVVLRANLAGNPTFKEFLSQTRQTVLAALKHQDYPFPLLVKRLQPARDPSRSPLFQVLFILQKSQQSGDLAKLFVPGTRMDWGDLKVEPFEMAQQEGQVDLALEMVEARETLHGVFKYNFKIFDSSTIARMAGHFQTLLSGIVANPQQQVSDLPLLTAAERHQLLVTWNDTQAAYPKHKCIHQLFEEQVERTPNAVAVVFEQQSLTYRELNARANQLAHYLMGLGIGPEVLVGICVERSIEMVVGLLGILKAGGAYVPLDPAYPNERLEFMLADANVKVLLTTSELLAAEHDAFTVCLDRPLPKSAFISCPAGTNPNRNQVSTQLAYVLYTSGSTGRPKGVAIEHRSSVALLSWAATIFGPEELAGVLASTSISFDLSVFELFLPLSLGKTVILAENALHLPNLPAKNKVTLINTVPSAMTELVLNSLPPSVLVVNLAGEPLKESLVEQIYRQETIQKVYNLYGPSEDTTYSTFTLVERGAKVTIGRPIANTQAYILDQHLTPVPIGVPGELYLGGAGLAREYLNRPTLTDEKFIPNPFGEGKLYKTGDLARYQPDSTIDFLGRADYQVKIRGFRIELGEIETALSQCVGVREAVVVVREEESDKRLVAYVVGEVNGLRAQLSQKLPNYMIPSAFVSLEAMPLTPNGKVNRRALPAPSQKSRGAYVAPRTSTEKTLTAIWTDLLAAEQVGIYDNFFDLGGHSLLATQVISRVRKTFQIDIAPSELLEKYTIAEFAELVEAKQIEQAESEALAQILAEIDQLSDDKVKQLLDQ